MTPEKLKQFLEKKFHLVDFIDLASLTASPTSIYKFFKSVYSEQYSSDQRIIIYTSHAIDDRLLAALYKECEFVDVSNYFVLVCTPDDINDQLQQVWKQHSSDQCAFQHCAVPLENTGPLQNNFELPPTVCAFPWSNIEIRSEGTITPCCNFIGSLGNIATDTVVDAFNSPKMRQLRQDLVDGKKPSGCRRCWDIEDQGLTSMRQNNTKRLKDNFLNQHFENPKIVYMDLKFQNTCNFKCRICNPGSSSLYAEEQFKHYKIKSTPHLKWSEEESFMQQVTALLPSLKNIDMYGGEPFLIKGFSKVLETAVNTGVAKNIRLHYNSNGSVWPERFVKYWPHFAHIDIHFSIDAVGDQFALERGGTWEEVESNILKIKNLNLPNLNISIMPTIGIMNVLYIDRVIDWAYHHNFQVFVNHVNSPIEYSLSQLTQEAKDLIIAKHQNNNWPEIKKILQLLKDMPTTDGKSFCVKTNWYDNVRGENFAETHSEIAKAMGYVYNKAQ